MFVTDANNPPRLAFSLSYLWSLCVLACCGLFLRPFRRAARWLDLTDPTQRALRGILMPRVKN